MGGDVRTLVLYADYTTRLSYYDDWMDALRQAERLDCTAVNICQRGAQETVRAAVRTADLIILLHSTNGDTTMYLEPFVSILQDRKGRLISFVGNELSLPGSPLAAKRAVFEQIHPDYVATQLLEEAGVALWGDLVTQAVISVPHALNPDAFRPELADAERPIDIGVRAVRYLPHLGDLDRNTLHDFFAHQHDRLGLVVDISTDRLNRTDWAGFLNRCKGTVSSEAGTWWLEKDDATINAIREWTADRFKGRSLVIANDSPLRRLGHKLPWWMRAFLRKALKGGVIRHESTVNEDLPFDEIYERFFLNKPRPPFYGKCISSRHFDAVGTKTCQILMRGRYNDILVAGQHYIPLANDFSDIDEALRHFRDAGERRRVADAAYAHVMEFHTYRRRVADLLDRVLA